MIGDLQNAARRQRSDGDPPSVPDRFRPGLGSAIAREHRERRSEIGTRRLARDDDARRIGPVLRTVSNQPRVSARRVLERRGIWVSRCEPVVDVEDHETAPREGEPHHPVGVLGEDPETAAVDVEHRGRRAIPFDRSIDVEPLVGLGIGAIGHVTQHLDAVPRWIGERVHPTHPRQAAQSHVDGGLAHHPARAFAERQGTRTRIHAAPLAWRNRRAT